MSTFFDAFYQQAKVKNLMNMSICDKSWEECSQRHINVEHCKYFKHSCHHGANCRLLHLNDTFHLQYFDHNSRPIDTYTPDFLHSKVCSYGHKCRDLKDSIHLSQKKHLCFNYLLCDLQEDQEHSRNFLHLCNEACLQQGHTDSTHFDKYIHWCNCSSSPCMNAKKSVCFHDCNNPKCTFCKEDSFCPRFQYHLDFYFHTNLETAFSMSPLNPVTEQFPQCKLVDKSTLKHQITDLLKGSNVNVQYNGQKYLFHGYQVTKNYCDVLGMVLQDPDDESQLEIVPQSLYRTGVQVLDTQVKEQHQPWASSEILVFKHDSISRIFDVVLNQHLEGTNMTFQDAIQKIHQHGYAIFVVGGAVRDVVRQVLKFNLNETNCKKEELKDIDLAFGASSYEIRSLFNPNEKLVVNNDTGRVTIGLEKPGSLFLEGKSIKGMDSDRNHSRQIYSSSVAHEAAYRDFTCNALFYDPINKTIVDTCFGNGIVDAVNNKLSISSTDYQSWCDGNPTKLIRYFYMLYKSYQSSDYTKNFVIDQLTACMNDAKKKLDILDNLYHTVRIGIMRKEKTAEARKRRDVFMALFTTQGVPQFIVNELTAKISSL